MNILFIDTHISQITLAIFENKELIKSKRVISNKNHSVFVMPTLNSLLEETQLKINDINEIIVCNGPGSFTGTRIGVTIAKTLAYTLNIKIKTITSLEIYANNDNNQNLKSVILRDSKGCYIGEFLNNKKTSEFFYLLESDFNKYKENKIIIEGQNDYNINKILNYIDDIEYTNAHDVNPIYIKKIEAENGKRS